MIAPIANGRSTRIAPPLRDCGGRFTAFACALLLALHAGNAPATGTTVAADEQPLRLLRSLDIGATPAEPGLPAPRHRLVLELAVIAGSGWSADTVLASARQAGRILAQCAIAIERIRLSEFDGPARYRYLSTRVSRELARRANLARPALFFVADTLHRPAFDAEAIGRANSRTRPEMADTVWITAGTRDLPIVIAHELVHVLSDSGVHSDLPRNLMREDTGPENTGLTGEQCRAIASTAQANGLLQRVP